MSDSPKKVLVRLTATVFRGNKKVKTETSTIHLTEDALICVKSALHAFAAALTVENSKTHGKHYD